ncbi:MAG: DUF4386 domain-containing protein [Candidatus Eiseniibacteriota bacterium]
MPSAAEIKATARQAGLLYLAMSLFAILGYFYLHPRFIVSGDAAGTARNILADEQLYRFTILIDLVTQFLFILVMLALYRLFKDVDRTQALLMVALVGTGIAAGFANFTWDLAPLILLSGADYLSPLEQPQLEALTYASIKLGDRQGLLLTSIWGLWLFPFAVLTIKSGFLPRFLGVLLILSGVAYVVTCVVGIAFPASARTVEKFALPLYFGEFIVVLWLAILGAKPRAAGG